MKVPVKTLDNTDAGEIELDDAIFGLDPRRDILHRMVNWQLAKRRAGTHKVKTVSEVSGTGKKPFRQKGTGRARQGTMRAPQMRGGAVVHGPVPRDHGFEMPKKVRKLALKHALSAKARDGSLIVVDQAAAESHKTKPLAAKLKTMGIASALVIDGESIDEKFALASRNIPLIDLLPQQGANVYDILRRRHLVLTKDAVDKLQERLK
ncbi:MAG: 50S ribosomal protein L4 [Alphaproteobacteria bacterium]|jgi:large subunit ribosomal protein L4|nr:50S ribosomal protein L4 [Alphaproteobacteria bacterium]